MLSARVSSVRRADALRVFSVLMAVGEVAALVRDSPPSPRPGDELRSMWLEAMVRTGRGGKTDEQLLDEAREVHEYLWRLCLGDEWGGDGDPAYANTLVWEIFRTNRWKVKWARRQLRREAAKDPFRRSEASRAAARSIASSRQAARERPAPSAVARPRPAIAPRVRIRARRRRAVVRRSRARSPGRPDPESPARPLAEAA
jgi:hypothetical protein